jgi:uncharacterized protein (TIGR02145 family)
MKKLNLLAIVILSITFLLNACSGGIKNNNSTSQDSTRVADSLKNSVNGTFSDSRDGKVYKTVKIGKQIWMAENLAYKMSTGCWAYNNDQTNVTTYGYLYSWESAKKACPTGWHLPSDAEWKQLTDYLGGNTIAGGKMKSSNLWSTPNNGATNESNFSALPGGTRGAINDWTRKDCAYIGIYGFWWSNSKESNNDNFIIRYRINSRDAQIDYNSTQKDDGSSVRCIKD